MRFRVGCAAALVVCVLGAAGCKRPATSTSGGGGLPGPPEDPRMPPPETSESLGDRADQIVFLPQNWTPEETLRFYSLPHGSQMIPYTWFLHLRRHR